MKGPDVTRITNEIFKRRWLSAWLVRPACVSPTHSEPHVTNHDFETSGDEHPIRAELFNLEQLERHAKSLATNHIVAKKFTPDRLLARLTENEQILSNAYNQISLAAERRRKITPAAEWLLDNYYLIDEQIRSTRRLLPKSYSKELPRLVKAGVSDFPRAYGIAEELTAHTDGRVDLSGLSGFIRAYQSVEPLMIGELWALPLMLKLALIENLRRIAVRVTEGRCHRDKAVEWAERMLKTVEQSPTDLVLVLADMARENPPLTGAFIAELTRHLKGKTPTLHLPIAGSNIGWPIKERPPSTWYLPMVKLKPPTKSPSVTASPACAF